MTSFVENLVWWGGLIIIIGFVIAAAGSWLQKKSGLAGVLLEIAGFVAALIGVWFLKPQQYAIPEITDPIVNERTDVCTIVRGTGEIPQGKKLVVASREHTGARYYLEGDVVEEPNKSWSVSIEVGDSAGPDKSKDKHFNIYAILLDEEWANYLKSTNEKGWGFWSSPELPPNAEIGEPVEVVGTGHAGHCQ